jgi:hypothetical protein
VNVFSHKIAEAAGLTAGSHAVATVPAGETWIVKDYSLRGQGVAGNTVYLQVGPAASVVDIRTLAVADEVFSAARFIVLEAGDPLTVAVIAGAWDFYASGYKLIGP